MIDRCLIFLADHLWGLHLLVAAIFLWKTASFFYYKTKSWNAFNWVYFDELSIINSRKKDHVRVKKQQNVYTLLLVVVGMVDLVVVLLLNKSL